MGAEVRSLHSPKRDHVAATRVTTDVGAFLRNHANGRAQSTNDGSVSSTHCVQPLLLQTVRSTKLLPVVQLRSGVILLMGDPTLCIEPRVCVYKRERPSPGMKGGHFVTSLPSAPRSAVLQSVHETAELSNILVKRNIPKDIVLIDPGAVNRLSALLSGAVDAAIVSPEERYAALDQGMKDLMFFGKEVKNSWGTFATSEWFLKGTTETARRIVRAVIKCLRHASRPRRHDRRRGKIQ